jgi:hypothetical protein
MLHWNVLLLSRDAGRARAYARRKVTVVSMATRSAAAAFDPADDAVSCLNRFLIGGKVSDCDTCADNLECVAPHRFSASAFSARPVLPPCDGQKEEHVCASPARYRDVPLGPPLTPDSLAAERRHVHK